MKRMKTVSVDDLVEDPNNARLHSERNVAAIAASLKEFGQQRPIVVTSEMVVIAGNGTLRAAKELGWEKIRVVETELEGADLRAFGIADNRTAELAEWDFGVLAEQIESLEAIDKSPFEACGFTKEELSELVALNQASIRGGNGDNPYTMKVEPPIYEARLDEAPPTDQLFDESKAAELIERIDAAELPNDVREFLRSAATRHIRFNYGQIAEFYCHADTETQRLMEESALIIVDFDQAIENGYVRVCERLREIAGDAIPASMQTQEIEGE